jgi:hypothetical protein
MTNEEILRERIISVLKEQGFKINPHVRPWDSNKGTYKSVQQRSRLEQISHHKEFLKKHFEQAKVYCRDGKDIVPEEIKLELREVKSDSFEEILFRFWNLTWWSIPYQRSYGRQMRFLLWDSIHDAPFGLIGLQSPVLKLSVRDNALEIPKDELDIWVNKSMSAQRVGALPPYNELLGGKMVALTLASNEIRDTYKRKYERYTTIIKCRQLEPVLLFITTTSAFGKSSLYNRLKYNKEVISECLGYTRGSGSFHISEQLYKEILKFLVDKDIDVTRGYGHGPSRKLKLISLGLRYLGLASFEFHGIKREFYLFPFVNNLREVIRQQQKPVWFNRSFHELQDYWKERWAMPRAARKPEWNDFKAAEFFERAERMLGEL